MFATPCRITFAETKFPLIVFPLFFFLFNSIAKGKEKFCKRINSCGERNHINQELHITFMFFVHESCNKVFFIYNIINGYPLFTVVIRRHVVR